jgi:TPR repeat protein
VHKSFTGLAAMLFALSVPAIAQATPVDDARTLLRQSRDAEAFVLIEQAADRNDPMAVDFLAWFYDVGRHVPADKAKAAVLYRWAAESRVPHAQWRLGVMIDEGETEGTLEEAVALFRAAAGHGFTNGYVSLGVMQSNGRGMPRDFAGALQSYKQAARLGNIAAFYHIGAVFYNGEGVPKDEYEALAWFIVAAGSGNDLATRHVGRLIDRLGESALPAATERANAIGREYGILRDPQAVPQPAGEVTTS